MPYHVLLDSAGEARLGKLRDRHDAARHRPLLRRQGGAARHPRPGPARRGDPAQEDHGRARAQAPRAAPPRKGPGARPARDDRGVRDVRPPARAAHHRHRAALPPDARAGRHGGVRGRPGHDARHRPRHVSVRHLVQPGRRRCLRGRRRRAEGDRRGVGRREGLRRRASARARSRPSSTTTSAATCSSAGTSTAPPPAASAAAAGSTSSRCATRRG